MTARDGEIGNPLEQAKSRPRLVEAAVRTALRDAIAWRIGGGSAPRPAAFVAAAIASGRVLSDARAGTPAECSRTLAAVERAANRFAGSALGRRLMTVPPSRIVRVPHVRYGPAVLVRDRRRRLHAIVLTAGTGGLEAGRLASMAAGAATIPVGDRLSPLWVHVYSLSTGLLHRFERDVPFTDLRTRVA